MMSITFLVEQPESVSISPPTTINRAIVRPAAAALG
jgi:hypothetical protein